MKKMDIHNLTAKDIKKLHIWLRSLIQVLYFLFIPSVYTAAFAGVKYIFTQIGAGEKVAMTSFVTVLVVICIYTILFGRFFCGFACAFGTLGDGVHALYVWICKKIKKKPLQIADAWTEKLCYLKYIVLALISILCFAGVYSEVKGTSPWDVFSMLHTGNFKLGGYLVGLVLLVLILVGMCFEEISARWELCFHCFRSFRFSHFTETEKTASKDVRHVRRNVLLTSDFRKMDLRR